MRRPCPGCGRRQLGDGDALCRRHRAASLPSLPSSSPDAVHVRRAGGGSHPTSQQQRLAVSSARFPRLRPVPSRQSAHISHPDIPVILPCFSPRSSESGRTNRLAAVHRHLSAIARPPSAPTQRNATRAAEKRGESPGARAPHFDRSDSPHQAHLAAQQSPRPARVAASRQQQATGSLVRQRGGGVGWGGARRRRGELVPAGKTHNTRSSLPVRHARHYGVNGQDAAGN